MKALKPAAAVLAAALTASLVGSLAGTADAATAFQTGISQQHRPTWGTNLLPVERAGSDAKSGKVWDTLTYGDISYIAGEFISISPVIDRAGALDGASGLPAPGFPSIDKTGVINTATPDGAGGWYIGGTFTNIAGSSRKGTARLAADGTLDSRWEPALATNQANHGGALVIHDLDKAGSHVYMAGEFTKFESQPIRNRIARVSESTGTLDVAWNPDANGAVRSVAASPDLNRIYIAGDFTALKGGTVPVPGFAALDFAGNVVPFNPAVGKVRDIAVSPDSTRVYVAGDSLAAIDAASGAIVWSHDGGGIASIALNPDGTRLYAGGDFNSLGGQARARLAAVDPATGAVDPGWIPDANGNVTAVTVSEDGTKVFVGGQFSQVRGYARNRLAAVDAATGTLDAWDPNADGAITILSASGNQVYTSGTFGTLGAQPRAQLGAIDIASGGPAGWAPQLRQLDSAGNPEADPPVAIALAISSDGSKIYVGGNFSHALGPNGEWIHRENLVAIDRISGLAVPEFNPGRVQGTVRGLALYRDPSGRDILYAGGDFESVRVSSTIQGTGRPDNPCPAGQNDCETLTNSAGKPNGSVSWKRPGLLAAFDAASGVLEVDFDKVPASTGPGLIGQSGKACSGSECGHGAIKAIDISPDGSTLHAGGTFSDLGGQLGMISVNRVDGSFTAWQADTSIPAFDVTVGPGGEVYAAMGGAGGKFQRFHPGGSSDSIWSAATDGDATSIRVSQVGAYGGGHFDFVDGQKHKHVVAMGLEGLPKKDPKGRDYIGANVADNFYAAANTNEGVFTVEVIPNKGVIFGGNFSEIGYQPDPLNRSNHFLYKPQPGYAFFPGTP